MDIQKQNRMNLKGNYSSINKILEFFGWPRETVYADNRFTGHIYRRYTVEELKDMLERGYKKMAKEHHPDVNGDPEIMVFINQLKDKAERILRYH